MAKLTAKKRKGLKKSSFALPGKRKYPIPDKPHARNALSRVSRHGSKAEKKAVRRKVYKKFPSLKKSSKKSSAKRPRRRKRR